MRIQNSTRIFNKKLCNFFIAVLLVNSVIDTVIMMYSDRSIVIPIQYGVNLVFLLFFLNYKWKEIQYNTYTILFLIIGYFLFLSLFSSNYYRTFNYLAKFIIPLPFFIVGYSSINSPTEFLNFAKKSIIILIYFVGYIVYANIFSFGTSFYGGPLASFKTGYMGLQGLYIPTFLIIQTLFLIPFYKNKLFTIVLCGLGIIIFVLILKRTNLLLLGLGLILWFYFERKIGLKYGILILIILGASSFIIFSSDVFKERISSRSSRFSSEYSITQEGRFKENKFIWEQVSESPLKLIFGSGEVFNDLKTMSEEADFVGSKGRQTHNSYARLLWSGGLLGVFLFLFFYFKLWQKFRFYHLNYKSGPLDETLYHLAISLIIIRVINDFSSGITYLTFNAFFYFTIGALLRVEFNSVIQSFVNYAKK